MRIRLASVCALAAAGLAGGADITFTEVLEVAGTATRIERTTSISGSRVAVDSEDITFIIDPEARSVTEIDRARAEFSAMSQAVFQARLASARDDLEASLEEEDASAQPRWSGIEIAFTDLVPGPRLLNVETQAFRSTFKAKLEPPSGAALSLTPTLTITNECAFGKPEGWQQIRILLPQSVEVGFDFMSRAGDGAFEKAAKQAYERLAEIDGAILRCVTRVRQERPPVAEVEIPASEVEFRSEVTTIGWQADAALFRIPSDYRAVEFPMTPQRMLAYLALPAAVLP